MKFIRMRLVARSPDTSACGAGRPPHFFKNNFKHFVKTFKEFLKTNVKKRNNLFFKN